MEPLPGYDDWKTTPPDLFDEPSEEEEQAEQDRYDDWVDSEIDRQMEDEP